jgi:hypothetical protein
MSKQYSLEEPGSNQCDRTALKCHLMAHWPRVAARGDAIMARDACERVLGYGWGN